MVKRGIEQEQTVITVRLDKNLDTFIEKYAYRRGESKSGLLVRLARELYEREQDRILDLELKKRQIQIYLRRLQALSGHRDPSKNYLDTQLKMRSLRAKTSS